MVIIGIIDPLYVGTYLLLSSTQGVSFITTIGISNDSIVA